MLEFQIGHNDAFLERRWAADVVAVAIPKAAVAVELAIAIEQGGALGMLLERLQAAQGRLDAIDAQLP